MTVSRQAALVAPKEPLQLREVELPPPGAGEVLVAIEACGLGQADYAAWALDAPPRLPLVLGQEAVGRVVAVGPGVRRGVGQRVGLGPLASTCGTCAQCAGGQRRFCAKVRLRALHEDGCLASHVLAGDASLLPAPEGPEAAALAPLYGAGWTAAGAVSVSALGDGDSVAVVGAGGVGQLAVAYAAARGARVVAVEPNAARLELARKAGASHAFEPHRAQKGLEAVGPLDAALVCTPSAQAVQLAVRAVRPGGVVVLAAQGFATRLDLPLPDVVLRGLRLVGSFLGAPEDLLWALTRAVDDGLWPRVEALPLEQAPEALWAVRDVARGPRLVLLP